MMCVYVLVPHSTTTCPAVSCFVNQPPMNNPPSLFFSPSLAGRVLCFLPGEFVQCRSNRERSGFSASAEAKPALRYEG